MRIAYCKDNLETYICCFHRGDSGDKRVRTCGGNPDGHTMLEAARYCGTLWHYFASGGRRLCWLGSIARI